MDLWTKFVCWAEWKLICLGRKFKLGNKDNTPVDTGKPRRNRDIYRDAEDRMEAWIAWSQKHTDKILTYNEWLDAFYDVNG